MNTLTKGTAIVAGTGVLFDMWVSVWLVALQKDTTLTKTITFILMLVLFYGLWVMYQGWKEQAE